MLRTPLLSPAGRLLSEESVKAKIEVKDKREAEAIQRAMNNESVRAFVIIVGALEELPTDRARQRVLQYVRDLLDEQKQDATPSSSSGTPPTQPQ